MPKNQGKPSPMIERTKKRRMKEKNVMNYLLKVKRKVRKSMTRNMYFSLGFL